MELHRRPVLVLFGNHQIPISDNFFESSPTVCKTWMKHGALAYFECVADDVTAPYGISFPKLSNAKKNETVIFAFIVFKSKAHRKQVNAKVHKEFSEMGGAENFTMPFDASKMAYGGFKTLIQG